MVSMVHSMPLFDGSNPNCEFLGSGNHLPNLSEVVARQEASEVFLAQLQKEKPRTGGGRYIYIYRFT
jgi:hypothetical protein